MRQTSIEAYNKIKENGLLSKARLSVYETLYKYGPLTGGEIFNAHPDLYGTHHIVKGSVCARLTELRRSGVVQEVGKRVCGITGRRAITWDVTPKLPVKFSRKEIVTKKELIGLLEEAIQKLRQRNLDLKEEIKKLNEEIKTLQYNVGSIES